jgi:hypothetical protein
MRMDRYMKNEENFKRAFEFLLKHAKSEKPFKLDELAKASGWVKGTAEIYLSKKFNDLVKKKSGVSLCVYNSKTTPPNNLECRAEEKMRCPRIQMVV